MVIGVPLPTLCSGNFAISANFTILTARKVGESVVRVGFRCELLGLFLFASNSFGMNFSKVVLANKGWWWYLVLIKAGNVGYVRYMCWWWYFFVVWNRNLLMFLVIETVGNVR